VPVQTVDATPSNQLIWHYLPPREPNRSATFNQTLARKVFRWVDARERPLAAESPALGFRSGVASTHWNHPGYRTCGFGRI